MATEDATLVPADVPAELVASIEPAVVADAPSAASAPTELAAEPLVAADPRIAARAAIAELVQALRTRTEYQAAAVGGR